MLMMQMIFDDDDYFMEYNIFYFLFKMIIYR